MATASNEFKLIYPRSREEYNRSAVTLWCRLSPEISAVTMEIRWFKETDCVCVYKNRQVTEGKRYDGRVSLFTQDLDRGKVSLELRDCKRSDLGHYLCQVTDGDRTEEITVEIIEGIVRLREEEWADRALDLAGDGLSYGDPFAAIVSQRDRKWTEYERMKMEKSALQTVFCDNQRSSDVKVFRPDLFEKCAEDKNRDEYRFLCPHAGQFMCKLTKLMFEMEGEGEVLYRIVSWDRCLVDRLDQKEPAGPLYSINCHKGLIKYLLLPHCETHKVELSVVHVTGCNVENIQPIIVTKTHVVIGAQHLSNFGILKPCTLLRGLPNIFTGQAYPIKAQVLLFCKKLNGKHRKNKLNIHLLPGNVPVVEVRKQHESNTYIEISGTCELTPGKKYWPFSDKNTDQEIKIQPECEKFKRDYGPNYHPTFEVFFNTEVDKINLGLRDENEDVVWKPCGSLFLTST